MRRAKRRGAAYRIAVSLTTDAARVGMPEVHWYACRNGDLVFSCPARVIRRWALVNKGAPPAPPRSWRAVRVTLSPEKSRVAKGGESGGRNHKPLID